MQVLNAKPRILTLFLALVLAVALIPVQNVQAEGLIGQVTASAESAEIGKTVTITFLSVPAVTVSAYQVTVSFDTGKFDFVSGSDLTGLNGASSVDNNGSSISVFAYGDTGVANISKLCKLTFRAKAEGTGTFSTSDVVINSESPVSTSVAVTVIGAGATTAATTTEPVATTTAAENPALEFSDGTYTVLPLPKSLATPAGFYRTALAIGGVQMEAFKSQKGDLVLIYLDSETAGANLFFYDSNFNSVYAYNPFIIPGHEFVLIRPDASAKVPAGFTATSVTIDGQLINCWKKAELDGPQDPYVDTYLLYLMDSDGQKGFFLYKPDKQMIFPYLLIEQQEGALTTETSSQAAEPVASQTDPAASQVPGNPSGFNLWMAVAIVLGLLSLMLIVFLAWTYFSYVRPAERAVASGRAAPPRPPKIRRVD
ncbi:MAG: hypothetical protein EOM70_10950 [Clostridia bacterium]|nr:hypothetical protein [Clostridia bacterium]